MKLVQHSDVIPQSHHQLTSATNETDESLYDIRIKIVRRNLSYEDKVSDEAIQTVNKRDNMNDSTTSSITTPQLLSIANSFISFLSKSPALLTTSMSKESYSTLPITTAQIVTNDKPIEEHRIQQLDDSNIEVADTKKIPNHDTKVEADNNMTSSTRVDNEGRSGDAPLQTATPSAPSAPKSQDKIAARLASLRQK
jgi:hypothetical protein